MLTHWVAVEIFDEQRGRDPRWGLPENLHDRCAVANPIL